MLQPLERSRLQLALLALGTVLVLASILAHAEGHLVAPLDDAYIYLQYARRLAGGHGLSYTGGQLPTAGATSLLWCLLLTPPFLVGLDGAWGLAWAQLLALGCLFACVRAGTRLLSRRVDAPWRGLGAGMLLFSGPLFWAAASGMETLLYAAALLTALERTDRHLEAGAARGLLPGLALLPLARPEGLVASLVLGGLLVWQSRTRSGASWPRAARFLAPGVLAAGAQAGLLLLWTGSPTGSGLAVKSWLAAPHMAGSEIFRTVATAFVAFFHDSQIRLHQQPSMAFVTVPCGLVLAFAGVLVPRRGEEGAGFRVAAGLVLALGLALPFLLRSVAHNHCRYHQALVPTLLVFLAIGLAELRVVISRRALAHAVIGAMLAIHLFGYRYWLFRLGLDASEIHHQHLRMARALDALLPPDALPALNDAGALPYATGRRFLDMVGLTTRGAAPAFQRGSGATFEWLDRRQERPTHYCGHDRWWRGFEESGLVGPPLFVASLSRFHSAADARLVLAPFRAEAWGAGREPCLPDPRLLEGRTLVDELDVAYPAHEEAHDYRVHARDGLGEVRAVLAAGELPGCGRVIEGGYPVSGLERFRLRGLAPGRDAWLVARYQVAEASRVELLVQGRPVAAQDLSPRPGWTTVVFELPGEVVESGEVDVELRDVGTLHHSFHYWLYR